MNFEIIKNGEETPIKLIGKGTIGMSGKRRLVPMPSIKSGDVVQLRVVHERHLKRGPFFYAIRPGIGLEINALNPNGNRVDIAYQVHSTH